MIELKYVCIFINMRIDSHESGRQQLTKIDNIIYQISFASNQNPTSLQAPSLILDTATILKIQSKSLHPLRLIPTTIAITISMTISINSLTMHNLTIFPINSTMAMLIILNTWKI